MRLIPLLLLLAACASPEAPPPAPAPAPVNVVADSSFDVASWMQRASPVWDTTSWSSAYDSTVAASRELARELDEALPWMAVCDFPANEESDSTSGWGIMHRYELAPQEHLVSISCEIFANQATFVIAHFRGAGARLVAAQQFDDTGQPRDTSALFVGFERVDVPTRTLSIFTRARGAGDCGTFTTYRVELEGPPQTLAVRVRECIDVREGEFTLPEQWEIVYPAQ
jgi:hypothetical protein